MDDEPLDPPLPEEDLERWLRLRCSLFAVALHRLTGLPIRAWIEFDEEIGATVLVHAFVADGDAALDAYGRRDPEELLLEYPHSDADLVGMTEAEILELGETPETVADLMEAALRDARIVADRFMPSRAPAP